MPSHYKLCNYSHNKKQMSKLYPLYIHYTRMYIWETWAWVAFRSTMAESTMRTGPFRKCQCPSICWCRSSSLQLCAHRHFWGEGLEEKKKKSKTEISTRKWQNYKHEPTHKSVTWAEFIPEQLDEGFMSDCATKEGCRFEFYNGKDTSLLIWSWSCCL